MIGPRANQSPGTSLSKIQLNTKFQLEVSYAILR